MDQTSICRKKILKRLNRLRLASKMNESENNIVDSNLQSKNTEPKESASNVAITATTAKVSNDDITSSINLLVNTTPADSEKNKSPSKLIVDPEIVKLEVALLQLKERKEWCKNRTKELRERLLKAIESGLPGAKELAKKEGIDEILKDESESLDLDKETKKKNKEDDEREKERQKEALRAAALAAYQKAQRERQLVCQAYYGTWYVP